MAKIFVLIAAVAGCVCAQSPEFDAASIKVSKAQGPRQSLNSSPGRITYANVSLRDALMAAYSVKDYQVTGPEWIKADRYDIIATAPGAPSDDEMKLMLQKLLNTRFQMTVHLEKRELPVYGMVISKSGTKLHEAENPGKANMRMNGGGVIFTSVTVTELIDYMSRLRIGEMDRPVIDHTGLKGKYDFTVNLFGTQEEMMAAVSKGDFGSSVFTLIQEQLGLKLEAQKLPIDMVIVDKAERTPTEN